MEKNMNMPLAGVRVVELATVVAAPTTSRMLCAYGAEVVKVETLYGDEMRRAGKTELTPYEDYKNPLFTVHNSNKRLTSINFKDPEGKAALLKLIGEADVFITNVREASLRRSGLDYDTLRESFPQLIYAHFSGFGPKGPVASNPGFDSTGFWLRSGPMADWQVEGSFPFVPTYAFGDMATSSVLLSGILMALLGREKTGCGMMDFPKVSLKEYTLKEAWGQITEWTDNLRYSPVCGNCVNRSVCFSCAAMVYNETGTFDGRPVYLCEKAKYAAKYYKEFLEKLPKDVLASVPES